MDASAQRAALGTQCYQRRRPERTLWYRTVQTHFETWLERSPHRIEESPPAYVERAFRRHLPNAASLLMALPAHYCDECKPGGHAFCVHAVSGGCVSPSWGFNDLTAWAQKRAHP